MKAKSVYIVHDKTTYGQAWRGLQERRREEGREGP